MLYDIITCDKWGSGVLGQGRETAMSKQVECVAEEKELCAECEERTLGNVANITDRKEKAKAHVKGVVTMLRVYANVKGKTPKEEEEAKEAGAAPAPAPAPMEAFLPALFFSVNKCGTVRDGVSLS